MRATKNAKQQGKHRSHVLPNFTFFLFEVNVIRKKIAEEKNLELTFYFSLFCIRESNKTKITLEQRFP